MIICQSIRRNRYKRIYSSDKIQRIGRVEFAYALSVILMVDEEYGITIEGKDIENVGTIEELFNTIESKK